jgi:hypothetical protein
MGAQLALMNSAIIPKLGTINITGPFAVNAGDTEIYFCASGGTYKVPIGGSAPTLVTPLKGISIVLNGAGDLFLFNPPTITKTPADGSASTVIDVPGLRRPQGMAMDSNGAFYIVDLGPVDFSGFVLRVSPTGVVSKVVNTEYGSWAYPNLITANEQGDIFVVDQAQLTSLKMAAWTGDFDQVAIDPVLDEGIVGTSPQNLAVDASNTVYFWDQFFSQNLDGMAYAPPSGQLGPAGGSSENGESALPLYTIPAILDSNGGGSEVPFYSAFGSQTMATSVSSKLYVVNGAGPGVFLVDRTQGRIPAQAFNPNTPFFGSTAQAFFVYNVGNQNATFTDPTRMYTESGNGVGSFTFIVPAQPPPPPPGSPPGVQVCMPGAVIAPGNYCAMYVSNTNWPNKGPVVTDTLHFLTNAVNNNSVSFEISGVVNEAP